MSYIPEVIISSWKCDEGYRTLVKTHKGDNTYGFRVLITQDSFDNTHTEYIVNALSHKMIDSFIDKIIKPIVMGKEIKICEGDGNVL